MAATTWKVGIFWWKSDNPNFTIAIEQWLNNQGSIEKICCHPIGASGILIMVLS